MQRDVNYQRDAFNIINDNSIGMPETVGLLARVEEASNSRDTRNNREPTA
jgi:hypothetical protein